MKGSFKIKAALIKEKFVLHKNKFIAIVVLLGIEVYLSFKFYSGEPDFPLGIFFIDVFNAIFRDMLLVSTLIFFRKYIIRGKEIAKDYRPIVVTAILWLAISAIIISSLKLILNVMTILSVLTGVINNIILVILAACIYAKRRSPLSKAIYFLTYLFTILIYYCDTIYFFVTSTHIERVIFENLNNYSISGVINSADKIVLIGIVSTFLFLLSLFRTPKKTGKLHLKNVGIILLLICISANIANMATAYVYPKVLLAGGFDEEGEIEKSRNLSRDMLSESVTINIIQEFLRKDQGVITATNQLYRVAFSKLETQLLDELGIVVGEKPTPAQKAFPYDKVVVIVAESFHRDYLHFYNPRIPAEATQFFDGLLAKYPHSDHYYTSNKPTTQGLNSMFLSQLIYSDEQSFENNVTLFKSLEKNGYDTVFLEATSQYYNDEFRAYKKRFGMHTYRAKEDLEKQGYIGSSGWGFHNDVMYEETIRILEQNRNNKIFMVTKTIDSHQPYPYCGFSKESIPETINAQHNNLYLKAIYWENMSLKKFFQDLEDRNLMDDKTLIIVTSDHNPHASQNDNYKRLGQEDLRLTLAPIPLIFISSNLKPFENFSSATYASQIDFAPTLLGILGFPSPPEFSGRNMLNVPDDSSYAIGFCGETVYYWSKDNQMKTDMYTGKNQNAYEKALVHWTQDLYVKYFYGNSPMGFSISKDKSAN